MWRDVQPRNLTLKRIFTHLTFHLSPRVWRERVCASVCVWQADELSVQGDEVTAQSDGVLQAPVHQNLSGPCSHLSSDTHTLMRAHTHTKLRFFICSWSSPLKYLPQCLPYSLCNRSFISKHIHTHFSHISDTIHTNILTHKHCPSNPWIRSLSSFSIQAVKSWLLSS